MYIKAKKMPVVARERVLGQWQLQSKTLSWRSKTKATKQRKGTDISLLKAIEIGQSSFTVTG